MMPPKHEQLPSSRSQTPLPPFSSASPTLLQRPRSFPGARLSTAGAHQDEAEVSRRKSDHLALVFAECVARDAAHSRKAM